VFRFEELSDSSIGNPDTINGFDGAGSFGGDVIDVALISTSAFGIFRDFTFLGEATTAEGTAFGAGALWLEDVNTQTRLFAITEDVIDLEIWINDGVDVSASDYFRFDFSL
ncbi:MAG: calcium-binding protein, partial [Sulfitobacter pontiacus]